MKRRLRKKLYKDEFAQLGFSFVLTDRTPDKMDLEYADEFIDKFVDQLVDLGLESPFCVTSMNGSMKASGIIMLASRYGGPSDEQIANLAQWIKNNITTEFKFSDIYDLNTQWDEYENWEEENEIE